MSVPDGSGKKFPAVVFGPGSGPETRDEVLAGQLDMKFGCGVPVFADLASGLAARGYASVRFDSRSCGPFNGCAQNGYPEPSADFTVSAELDDLRAAAAWLAQQPEVDASKIVYVGHSEGASFAPTLLGDADTWQGAVMLAAAYHPVDALVAIQLAESRQLLALSGAPEAQVAMEFADLQQAVTDLAALRGGTFKGSNILGGTPAYWKSLFELTDAAPMVAASSAELLLVLSGDYDRNVPPAELAAWRDLFSKGKPSVDHETKLLPCVTHALNCISQPDITSIRSSDIGCHVDQQIIDAVIAFLDGVAGH